MCIADIHTEGFRCWNTDRDILDQYETFNRLPVYCGGDLFDSEDSEWDDPYALASAAYVEDYNFDVPEGMDLMVHRQSRLWDGSEAQQDDHTDMVPVCQMVSCVTRNGWYVFDDDSLMEATVVDSPNMDDYYHWVVSSDEGDCIVSDIGSITDFIWDMSGEEGSVADLASASLDVEICCDSDAGSVADLEWNTWDDACALAFRGEGGAFPPEAAVLQPAVVFRDILLREEERDIAVTDGRIAMIPPVTNSESVDGDAYNGRLCLRYPDSVEDLQDLWDGYVNSQGLNHWHTVSWDPGVADSRVLSVCYDCLCLMVLFWTVMSQMAPDWVEVLVWTGHDEGSCHSTGWELRYLTRIYPPCVVDRLGGSLTEIRVPRLGLVLSEDKNNSARQCAGMRQTPLRVFSTGRISLTLIGCQACVGGSVNCSDWPRLDCAVDFSGTVSQQEQPETVFRQGRMRTVSHQGP